jgi:hypothetical protein
MTGPDPSNVETLANGKLFFIGSPLIVLYQ